MTWKSTAAAGAMVVATWLASHAPVGGPREPASAVTPPRTEAAAAAIQQEADRLHARLRQVTAYQQPTRNPFRFNARVLPPAPRQPPAAAAPAVIAPVEAQPAPFRLVLAGIGEDGDGDGVARTAIISTPDNVHLVKLGDTVEGYTVAAIAADSVELVHASDGSTRRLALRP